MFQTKIKIENNIELNADIYPNQSNKMMIFAHGFKGFKSWGFNPYICKWFQDQGYTSIAFNFSHNGHIGHSEECTDLKAFEENTFKREELDLRGSIQAVSNEEVESVSSPKEIILVAHSRGAQAVACNSSKLKPEPEAKVSKSIFLAPISHLWTPSEEEIKKWKERGYAIIVNSRTNQELKVGLDLLDEMLKNPDKIEEHCKQIEKPCLIIHGTEDPTVPLQCAKDLKFWINNSKLEIIEGGNHSFGATHPFEAPHHHLELVLSSIKKFI